MERNNAVLGNIFLDLVHFGFFGLQKRRSTNGAISFDGTNSSKQAGAASSGSR
jgi:hypothetical protein